MERRYEIETLRRSLAMLSPLQLALWREEALRVTEAEAWLGWHCWSVSLRLPGGDGRPEEWAALPGSGGPDTEYLWEEMRGAGWLVRLKSPWQASQVYEPGSPEPVPFTKELDPLMDVYLRWRAPIAFGRIRGWGHLEGGPDYWRAEATHLTLLLIVRVPEVIASELAHDYGCSYLAFDPWHPLADRRRAQLPNMRV